MRGRKQLHLLSVEWEEDQVQDLATKAARIFERNVVGPRKYMKLYEQYTLLLNGEAAVDRDRE